MNSNTRARFSILYANARTVLDLIWLRFQGQPEKHVLPQVSEKKEQGEMRLRRELGGEESLFSRESGYTKSSKAVTIVLQCYRVPRALIPSHTVSRKRIL